MFIQKISSRSLRFVLMTVASMILSVGAIWAQNVKVSGTVTDKTGEPLIGVYVMVQGTTTGTSTDFDGKYVLEAPANGSLVFQLMGMTEQVVAINNRSVVDVVMEEDAVLLDDVVVTALGTAVIDIIFRFLGKSINRDYVTFFHNMVSFEFFWVFQF